jgi:hypothetical protein
MQQGFLIADRRAPLINERICKVAVVVLEVLTMFPGSLSCEMRERAAKVTLVVCHPFSFNVVEEVEESDPP